MVASVVTFFLLVQFPSAVGWTFFSALLEETGLTPRRKLVEKTPYYYMSGTAWRRKAARVQHGGSNQRGNTRKYPPPTDYNTTISYST